MSVRFLGILVLLLAWFSTEAQRTIILDKKSIQIEEENVWNLIAENGVLKPEFQYVDLLNFYRIKYDSYGVEVDGFIIEPKENDVYPAIIFNKGGNNLTFKPLGLQILLGYVGKLAAEGYVIMASNYRKEDQYGGDDVFDVLSLVEATEEVDKANPARIGMLGWSRGSIMTYRALTFSSHIKTAVIGNGASDLFTTVKNRPGLEESVFGELIPNYFQNKEQELTDRSAIYWPSDICKQTSLLLLCGTYDQRVSYKQTEQLADTLQKLKYNVSYKQYDTDHFFTGYKEALNKELADWFRQNL